MNERESPYIPGNTARVVFYSRYGMAYRIARQQAEARSIMHDPLSRESEREREIARDCREALR